MFRSRVRRTVLAFVTVSAMVACGSSSDDKPTAATSTTTTAAAADRGNVNKVLELGHLAPQSGPFATMVKSVTTPVEMALEEINAAGGVNGAPVKLAVRDDGADQAIAAAALDQLLESDKVDVVLGPSSSAATLAILDKVKTSGVLTCGGSATAAALSTADSGGYFFRTAPPDGFQGPALAEVMLKDGRSKPAIIARNDSYGAGLGRSVSDSLIKGGAQVSGGVITYDPAGTSFEAEVQRVVDAAPDSVVVLGFPDDGAKIIKAMVAKNVGPAQIPIYTTDGLQGRSFGATVDPANPGVVKGIKGTAPAAAPGGIESPFNTAFQAKGLPPIYSAYYYDCTILSALAAVKAGSDDPAKMKGEFASNLAGKELCNTFAACTAALEAGKTIHYSGASSTFDKWNTFEPGSGVYDLWSYNDKAESVTEPAENQITIG